MERHDTYKTGSWCVETSTSMELEYAQGGSDRRHYDCCMIVSFCSSVVSEEARSQIKYNQSPMILSQELSRSRFNLWLHIMLDRIVVTSPIGLQIPAEKPRDWFHCGFYSLHHPQLLVRFEAGRLHICTLTTFYTFREGLEIFWGFFWCCK